MSRYTKYNFAGCTVLSSFEIPELIRCEIAESTKFQIRCDIHYKDHIDDQDWDHTWLLRGLPSLWYKRLPDSHLLRFSDQIEFEISLSLTHVVVCCSSAVSHEFVCHALVDQLLPRLIAQRGMMVLHGCALLGNDGVTLFLGESGWGKSTLAHFLSARGMTLFSDDCVVLSMSSSGKTISCSPTYPSLRLREEGISEFYSGGLPESAISITEAGKYRVPITETVESYESVLNRIVFLSDPTEAKDHVEVFEIPAVAAAMKLVGNCFRLDMSDKDQTLSLLNKAATIVETVRLCRLSYPHDFSRLEDVAAAIDAL